MYVLERLPNGGGVVLHHEENGKRREVAPRWSQRVYNHSPDGFEMGYGGSGPAQAALAIMLDYLSGRAIRLKTGEPKTFIESHACMLHQDFKFDFVARAHDKLLVPDEKIEEWISNKQAAQWRK